MGKKKLLLAVTHAGFGGVAKHVIDLAHYIKDYSDWEVDIACGNQKRDLIEAYKKYSDNLIIIKDLVRELSPIKDFFAYKNIKNIIKNNKYDVVHAHGAKAGILFRRAAHSCSVPSIYTHHLVVYKQFKTLLNPVYKFVETKASDWCSYVVVVTGQNKRILSDDGVVPLKKLKIVYNGLSTTEPQYTREFARKALGMSFDKFVIASVTRLDKPKDPLTLLNGFTKFHKTNQNSILMIIGDGSLKKTLDMELERNNITGSVIMPGFVSDVDLYLAAADVFCLATEKEGLPIAILEAMKYSLPIIATDVDGIPEQVKDGWNGHLIPIHDDLGFMNKLNVLYSNKKYRNEQGINSKKILLQNFVAQKNYKHLVDIYDGLNEN